MDVALVLHSHLPRLARNGTYPVGEQWLHEAVIGSYLPLLEMLERLGSSGYRDLLTVGVTPVLAEQLADPYVHRELHGWAGRRLLDLAWTVSRYRGPDRERLRQVWAGQWRRSTRELARLERRLAGDGLVRPLAALASAEVIELLGGPATHPYLPLHTDLARIRAQVGDGLAAHAARFGAPAAGIWPPELGYRPAGDVGDATRPPERADPWGNPRLRRSGVDLPGLEEVWQEAGVGYVVLDGPTLARAAGAVPQDWSQVGAATPPPGSALDAVDRPVRIGDSDVVAFGRNLPVSYAVWSPAGGYPTDPAYRDFHTVDLEGGVKAWRVTGLDRHGPGGAAVGGKEPYDEVFARERAVAHAEAFVALLRRYAAGRDPGGVVVAAFDTELFGHWWFEGPVWLETVLRRLADDPVLRPTTLAGHLARRAELPPRAALPESSWGAGKGHASWVAPGTRGVWSAIREAQACFSGLAPGRRRDAAARQLELLEASDWPFMIARDRTAAYGHERVAAHRARFDAACAGEALERLTEVDGPPVRQAPIDAGHGADPSRRAAPVPGAGA